MERESNRKPRGGNYTTGCWAAVMPGQEGGKGGGPGLG